MAKKYKKGYVVIGAGHAGISAAEQIHRYGPKERIYIIDPDPDAFYFRAGMKFMIKGKLADRDLEGRPSEFFTHRRVKLISQKALRIHREEKWIELDNGDTVPYHKLLLATGGTPFIPPIHGLNNIEVGVHRTLADTREICEITKNSGEKCIIIGGGVLGVELAEALALQGVRVVLITMDDQLIPRMLDTYASSLLTQLFDKHQVKIHFSSIAEEISRDLDTGQYTIKTNNGSAITGDYVYICTGIRRETAIAKAAGLKTNIGIQVNEYLQTNDPNIFAAGDVCEYWDSVEDRYKVIELWGPAGRMGKIAGTNMLGYQKAYANEVFHAYTLLFKQNIHVIGTYNPSDLAPYEIITSKYDWNGEPRYFKLIFKKNQLVGALTFGEAREALLIEHYIKQKTSLPSGITKQALLHREFDWDELIYARSQPNGS